MHRYRLATYIVMQELNDNVAIHIQFYTQIIVTGPLSVGIVKLGDYGTAQVL